ncbi:MAG: Holliday junction resolvase RuvX [Trueperella sp.]|nr:Holliday junction resolvase RuvX [Trueperella sp.]
MRPGARVAVDVGAVRVGVAKCDSAAILATPVATLRRYQGDQRRVAKLARQIEAIEIIVGLPLNMDGSAGAAAQGARKWAQQLQNRVDIPVRLVDERLSTVSAHQQLRQSGRKEIDHKSVVDQAAAVIILESALEFERRSGRPPGEPVGKGNESAE